MHAKYLLLLSLMAFGCRPPPAAPPLAPAAAPIVAAAAPAVAATGQTRALLLFVRFADDDRPGNPCLNDRGWPLYPSPETLPTYAHHLLAPTPKPPFADSTLTAYFYEQSEHRYILYGTVYPEVLTSTHPRTWYHRKNGKGYGYLAQEVLARIDPKVDFTQYDTNPKDGVLDQVFIVIRSDPAATFTGVAHLGGADAVAGRPAKTTLAFDGVQFHWARSGSYIIHERPGHILTQPYMVRLMAHEFGHHLWNSRGAFAGHLPAIRTNDVPANGTNRIGYVLMAGRGGGLDMRGDELISPIERELLGWTTPALLDRPGPVTLGDAYTTGAFKKIVLADGNPATPDPALYVSNRQRIGPFDQRRIHRKKGCNTYDMGLLRTTGLLVQMGLQNGRRMAVDVLPADNTLELSIQNDTYTGDLYGPSTRTQLTPWTRPSTARHDGIPSWVGLDRIRYTGGPNGEMAFDFQPDFRASPVIRAPSWMGQETSGYAFTAPVEVTNQATLYLTADTLTFNGGVRLDSGTRLDIAAGARLYLNGPVGWGTGAEIVMHPGAALVLPDRTLTTTTVRRITAL